MKRNFLRLCLMLGLISLNSCRQDILPEHETYNNSSAFQLTSKRISLNEAKHKAKLVPEIDKVETGMTGHSKSNVQAKTVNYGNGVSIDTDEVIYLEKGPDYYTYTFRINRENASANAPIENLVLSPLPDGTWKEVLVTYYLTPQERENMLSGIAVDLTGKVTRETLQNGTYSSAIVMQDVMTCHLEISTYYTRCGESDDHHQGELTGTAGPCRSETPSVLVVSLVRKCTVALPVDTGLGEDGEGGGSGPQNGPGGLSNNPPEETTTAPNLPPKNKKTPCQKIVDIGKTDKTKTLFQNLKTKTNSTKEFGEILVDNGLEITNTSVEGEAGQGGINIDLSTAIDGFIHSHYAGLLSVFSPGDLATISGLYKNGLIKNPDTFVFGLVTASNTQYIMVIDDPVKFTTFAQQFLTTNGQIDIKYTDNYGKFNYQSNNIKETNLSNANELGIVKLLANENSGLKILKGSNNSNDWAELNIKNGLIDPKPCN
jgi:hypothetical protein